MIKYVVFLSVLLFFCACNDTQNETKLNLTSDELVYAMVEMYTANAAIQINDASLRDSTADVYFKIISDKLGKSTEEIRKDFEILTKMPDSLLVLQGRALDTFRVLIDKNYSSPNISIGIN